MVWQTIVASLRVRDHWGSDYPLFKSHYSETGHPFNQQPLLICSPRRLCLTARPVASFLCVKLAFHESHSSQPISCALVLGGRILFWWSDSILYFFWEAESSHLPSWRHWYQVFDYHDHINKVSLLMTLWNLTTSTVHKEPPLIRGTSTCHKGWSLMAGGGVPYERWLLVQGGGGQIPCRY